MTGPGPNIRAMRFSLHQPSTVTPPGGPTVAYRQLGRGENMFVLHGGSGSYRHWIRNLEPLAERFTLFVLDLPGFGDSGDVPRDISMDQYVTLTAQAFDMICPPGEPFHVVGFSFGGMIGSGVAVRMQERMRRLTLLAPGGMGNPTPNKSAVNLLRARPGMAEEEILRIHRTNLENMMLADPRKIDEETVRLHRANIERARFRNWGLSWQDCVVDWLAQSHFPAQFLLGEHDVMARPSVEHRLGRVKEAKPDIETHIIPNAGHWAQYEAHETATGLLLRFHGATG